MPPGNNPFQGRGMGSPMMPQNRSGSPFQIQPMNGFQGGRGISQPGKRGGGLLSKILGGSNQAQGQGALQQMGAFQQGSNPRGGGGILSNLLGGGNTAGGNIGANGAVNGIQGFERAAGQGGGSILKNMLNPNSINSFLNNTQGMLKTAQQVGPMIQQFQQYGPLVKNLPAMWKLYRGLNASDDTTEDKEEQLQPEEQKSESVQKKISKKKKKKIDSNSSFEDPSDNEIEEIEAGTSRPKLYV